MPEVDEAGVLLLVVKLMYWLEKCGNLAIGWTQWEHPRSQFTPYLDQCGAYAHKSDRGLGRFGRNW